MTTTHLGTITDVGSPPDLIDTFVESVTSAVTEGCFRPLERDAEFGKRAGSERVPHAQHAEQHMLVSQRLIGGTVDRLGERLLQTRRDALNPGGARLEHPRARPLECAVSERVLQPVAHGPEVDPSVARASGSIRGAHTPARKAEALTCLSVTPNWRRTRAAPPCGLRVNTSRTCSVPM
jgi:hypothetical protein